MVSQLVGMDRLHSVYDKSFAPRAHTHILAVLDGERRLHDRKKFRDTILAVAHGTLTLAALRLGVDCTHARWANVV